MKKKNKIAVNWSLLVALIGLLGFAGHDIWFMRKADRTVAKLTESSIRLAGTSYFYGCIEATTEINKLLVKSRKSNSQMYSDCTFKLFDYTASLSNLTNQVEKR